MAINENENVLEITLTAQDRVSRFIYHKQDETLSVYESLDGDEQHVHMDMSELMLILSTLLNNQLNKKAC